MIDIVLEHSKSLQIYGPENWKKWPEYRPYYKYFLDNSNAMRNVYQTSKINLHEGVGPHFRVFDCFASGGFLFFHKSADDSDYGGMHTFFKPNVHYVDFDYDDFSNKVKYYLANEDKRLKIAGQASKIVRKHHTWYHRWQKIIKDCHSL